MSITEAGLELLLKKLQDQILSTVESLSDSEISLMHNKIPHFHTMMEFRQTRDQFLTKFNSPCKIPEESSYSIDLLRHASDDYELPDDTNLSLEHFFKSEYQRVSRLRKTVLSRCTQPEFFSVTQMEFALYDKSVTKYLFGCQEGILRLKCKEYASFTINDLMLELYATFFQKRRKAFLRSLLIHVRRFSLTSQQSIFTRMFDTITKRFKEDMNAHSLPFLPDREQPINEELKRLSQRLNVKFDFEVSDGQKFLYNCKKRFFELFKELDFYNLPKKKYDFSHYPHQTNISQLTNHTLLSITTHDPRLTEVFNSLFDLPTDELIQRMRQKVNTYNLLVGNEYRSVHFHGERERNPIPIYKIDAWFRLRFIHTKYLAISVLSHINYFQYLCAQLLAMKPNVMKSTQFRSRRSKFKEIIEIYDSNGSFIFEDALRFYKSLVNSLIEVGSYYILKFEETSAERKGNDSVIIDYESMCESLLQYELDFLNAKRMLVQPLIECLEHKLDDHLTYQIFDIIIQRPNFNLSVYNSFDTPYKLAINLMQKKANVIRTLVNLQILHERSFSSQFNNPIPIFDRPSQIPIEVKYRSFYESIEISPFEVYESLNDISKFVDFVPKLAQELSESIDFKTAIYVDYLTLSIWEEIEKINKDVFENGFFPFDRSSTKFHFNLSDTVKSLFISPYVNTVNAIKKLISKMKESRKLRFMLSTRRFMHLAWKLQKLIIETDLLQHSYYNQCDQLGITEKGIRMAPFKDSATKEIIDLHSEVFDINILEFALTEFETISLKFDQSSSIKDIIFAADFSGLKRMIRFQKLQNTILEIAIRFNRHLIDNNFLVSYFELGADSAMFLTGVDLSEFTGDEENERRFIKGQIADRIFYQSMNIFRDNQITQKDKEKYCLSIKTLKLMSRTILSAHVKQKSMTHQEMFEMYISEMVDKFAVFGLKVEIAEVCNLERRIILTNTFVDAFILGPEESTCLINNLGQFEKFFYVPTWYECFVMMRDAPHARQGMILRSVLKFLVSRFRILNHARFECSLSQRIETVFESLYYRNYKLETPIFQKLVNDFAELPNSKEVEIATKYILETEKFLFYRLEFLFLTSLENFYVSVNTKLSDSNKNSANANANVDDIDMRLGKKIQNLWLSMHKPHEKDKYLIIASRYAPLWQEHFLYNCIEHDRADIAIRLESSDAFLDDSLSSNYNKEILSNPIKKMPLAIDFLSLAISQLYIKFAYFLLRNGVDENIIDQQSCILLMNEEVYRNNFDVWERIILKQANLHLVPKDESPSRVTDTIPEPKLEQVIFDVIRNEVDLLILTSQTHHVEKTTADFESEIQKVKEIVRKNSDQNTATNTANATNPTTSATSGTANANSDENSKATASSTQIENSSQLSQNQSSDFIDRNLGGDQNEEEEDDDDDEENANSAFYVRSPKQYNRQFMKEGDYAHNRVQSFLFTALEQNTIIKEENLLRIDLNHFTDSLHKISAIMKSFEQKSLLKENETWTKYLSNVTVPIESNKEEMESASILATLTKRRIERQANSEISDCFSSMFLTVNQLRQNIRNQQQKEVQIQQQMKEKIIDYYDNLIFDLNKAIEGTKKQEDSIKAKVYDDTMKKIRNARTVTVQMKTTGILHDNNDSLNSPSESEPGSTFTSQAQFVLTPTEQPSKNLNSIFDNQIFNENLDENFLNELNEKNKKMKKEILLLRCLRVLSEIGVKRYYQKVIVENIKQRKLSNAQLWDDRFQSEIHETSLDSELQEAHHLLSDSKLEIEKLDQQLENIKMSNIQLVHWKAKNIKKIDSMKQQLTEFDESIEDVDIDNLIKTIADKQAELDELRENNIEIDDTIEQEIRKPMKIVEEIKAKVKDSKNEKRKMKSLQIASDLNHQEVFTNKELFVQELSDANIQLRLSNDQLNKQIQDLENQKKLMSERAKSLMEETMKARKPLKMQTRASTRIVKPAVKSLVSRSLSRI